MMVILNRNQHFYFLIYFKNYLIFLLLKMINFERKQQKNLCNLNLNLFLYYFLSYHVHDN